LQFQGGDGIEAKKGLSAGIGTILNAWTHRQTGVFGPAVPCNIDFVCEESKCLASCLSNSLSLAAIMQKGDLAEILLDYA